MVRASTLFTIAELTWAIQLVPEISPYLKDGELLGTCRTHEKKIYVSQELDRELGARVIIHELAHAMMATYKNSRESYSHLKTFLYRYCNCIATGTTLKGLKLENVPLQVLQPIDCLAV
jgi:hypothetical protein